LRFCQHGGNVTALSVWQADFTMETGSMSDVSDAGPESRLASFWRAGAWRPWLGGLAGAATLALALGAWLLPATLQIAVVQFMIPPYSYVCLGLAAIALVEAPESRPRRVLMALILAALALLSLFSYAAGGVPPLFILALHVGFLVGWIAWPRRAAWTFLWLAETLAWIAVAFAQGRLP
jgi:hypothetical protein